MGHGKKNIFGSFNWISLYICCIIGNVFLKFKTHICHQIDILFVFFKIDRFCLMVISTSLTIDIYRGKMSLWNQVAKDTAATIFIECNLIDIDQCKKKKFRHISKITLRSK